jgi:hypothetical protein
MLRSSLPYRTTIGTGSPADIRWWSRKALRLAANRSAQEHVAITGTGAIEFRLP